MVRLSSGAEEGMEQILTMRSEDSDQLRVIREVLDRKVSWQDWKRLSLSVRQIGYLCARVREEGNKGIISDPRATSL